MRTRRIIPPTDTTDPSPLFHRSPDHQASQIPPARGTEMISLARLHRETEPSSGSRPDLGDEFRSQNRGASVHASGGRNN